MLPKPKSISHLYQMYSVMKYTNQDFGSNNLGLQLMDGWETGFIPQLI